MFKKRVGTGGWLHYAKWKEPMELNKDSSSLSPQKGGSRKKFREETIIHFNRKGRKTGNESWRRKGIGAQKGSSMALKESSLRKKRLSLIKKV